MQPTAQAVGVQFGKTQSSGGAKETQAHRLRKGRHTLTRSLNRTPRAGVHVFPIFSARNIPCPSCNTNN